MPLKPGNSGLFLLQTVNGTGASGVLTLTVPAGYQELELTLRARGDTVATLVGAQMTFNGDTTATNYNTEIVYASAAVPGSVEALGSLAYLGVGDFPAASSTANLYSTCKIWIPEYASTTGFKTVHCHNAGFRTLTTTNLIPQYVSGCWESETAITSIVVTASAGNWTTATVARLWGKR